MTYYHDSHINAKDYDNDQDVSIVKVWLEDERDYERYNINEDCDGDGFLVEISVPTRTSFDGNVRTTEQFFTSAEMVQIIKLGVNELRARKQEAYEWETQQEIDALNQLYNERLGIER